MRASRVVLCMCVCVFVCVSWIPRPYFGDFFFVVYQFYQYKLEQFIF